MATRALARTHKAVGLALALLLGVQALSGLALVFREELLLALNRRLLAEPPPVEVPAIGRALAEGARQFGAQNVERAVLPQGERTAVMLYVADADQPGLRVFASDPRSGKVLGEITGWGGLPFALFRFHDELFLGSAGHAVLLVAGLGAVFLMGAGLVLARPGRRSAWRIRWRGDGLRRGFDAHRVTGLCVAPLVLFSSLTGAIMHADFLARAPQSASLAPARRPGLDWAAFQRRLEDVARLPSTKSIEDVRLGVEGGEATILAYTNEIGRPLALDRFVVDLADGRMSRVERAAQASRARRFLAWMYPLHSGKAFGAAGAAAVSVSGIGLILLPLLGVFCACRR